MASDRQYIPVLRYKFAERLALRHLYPLERQRVTPLIEMPPSTFVPRRRRAGKPAKRKQRATIIRDAANAMKIVWGDRPFFFDFGLLDDRLTIQDKPLLDAFAAEARKRDLLLIPVASIRSTPEQRDVLRNVLATDKRGVCIRVKELDLIRDSFITDLKQLFKDIKSHPKRTDLIIDFEEYYEGAPTYLDVCARIPAPDSWRSFTVISGAFSKDLTQYKVNEVSERRRADWIRWHEQCRLNGKLPRVPGYGDYTVQFARYEEPPSGGRPSASVRYATRDKWLVLRGEATDKEHGPGREQYTMWARVLSRMDDFSGPKFSAGDAYIAQRAADASKTGDPTWWLFAAINHHITLTVRQLASLGAA